MHADIIAVGGGLIGLSSALHLAKDGKKVIVLEKDFIGKNASGVNAGGVRSLKRDLREVPMIQGALEMWYRMKETVGSDCGFFKIGYLIAAETDADMADLEKRAAVTRSLGYSHERIVDKQQVKALVPSIAPHCVGGIMSDHDGNASPAETCRAFYRTCLDKGVLVHTGCEVLAIDRTPSGFRVETSSAGVMESEQILNCAGAWAARIGAMLDDPLPVTPVGPSVMVTAPMPRMFRRHVTANRRKLWLNQVKNGSIFLMGGYLADADLETGQTRLRFSALQRCAQTAHDLVAELEQIPIVRAWAGLDGNTPDDIPIIGYSKTVPGLMHACGFSKHGFALSPMVGNVVSKIMQAKEPGLSVKDFDPERL
ncbi:MAG: FAD-binding oxidoreductase [Desulfobacterales bacterium]|nr:FAD-binding oxidoreductase [Desulfobacterales bacterium]